LNGYSVQQIAHVEKSMIVPHVQNNGIADGVWVRNTQMVHLVSVEVVLVLILDILVLPLGIGLAALAPLPRIPVVPIRLVLCAMHRQHVDGDSILNHSLA